MLLPLNWAWPSGHPRKHGARMIALHRPFGSSAKSSLLPPRCTLMTYLWGGPGCALIEFSRLGTRLADPDSRPLPEATATDTTGMGAA